MFKNMKISSKVFLGTSVLILVNLAILVYQFAHLVISAWNIVPSLILVFVIFGNMKNMLHPGVKDGTVAPSQFGAPPTSENVQNSYRENEDFFAINTSFPTKLTVKSIAWKCLFLAIFIGLSFLFGMLGSNIKYDSVVQGTIIDKTVEGDVYTEVTDDGVSTTDTRYMVYLVSYEVNGTIYRIEVEDKFATSREGNLIRLCVKSDGEFVCIYDATISYKIMFYVSIALAVLTALSFVLKLPNQFLAILVIIFVGMGIICLLNSGNWASWLLNDFTLFGGCFVTLGVTSVIELILLRIIHTIGSRRDSGFKLT